MRPAGSDYRPRLVAMRVHVGWPICQCGGPLRYFYGAGWKCVNYRVHDDLLPSTERAEVRLHAEAELSPLRKEVAALKDEVWNLRSQLDEARRSRALPDSDPDPPSEMIPECILCGEPLVREGSSWGCVNYRGHPGCFDIPENGASIAEGSSSVGALRIPGVRDHRDLIRYLLKRDRVCKARTCVMPSREIDGAKIDGYLGPGGPSIDHIVPRAMGGSHTLSNIQLTHLRCNIHKGARWVG